MMTTDLPLSPKPQAPRGRRARDFLLMAGLVALFAAGVAGLLAATGWEETRAQIARLTLAQGAALLALSLVNYLLRGLRWHLFARRLGLSTRLVQDLRHFLGGFAMVVTPGRLGELVRMRWLRRETGWAFERTAPLALMDRAADLAAMAIILGLFVVSVLMILAVATAIWIVGEVRGANGVVDANGNPIDPGFLQTVWWTLLRTLDPGTMGGDQGAPGFVLAMFLITLGGIFIVAILIGIISTGIEGRLDELRKGRSRVIEDGHTVILGWSQSIFTIVEELIAANANRRRQHIVILADRDKVEMEDELRARIKDRKTTTIVCRSGSPIDLDEIDIASHQTSRAVIVHTE